MSYEQYARTSRNYDLTRQPIGVPIILGCLATTRRQLCELIVLDAGCGTGSYALAISPWVKQVHGVDASKEMIEQATRKLHDARVNVDRLTVRQGRLEKLPFDDGGFDAAMVNQVLHHLDDDPGTNWPVHRKALLELRRVLRPGGVLVVNLCSHAQIDAGWWYRDLFHQAFERFKRKLIPLSILIELLEECGYSHQGSYVPVDAVFQGDAYFDPEGPLRDSWRDGDSVFALVTRDELEFGLARMRDMLKRGDIGEYLTKQDSKRVEIGQVTFVRAVKSGRK